MSDFFIRVRSVLHESRKTFCTPFIGLSIASTLVLVSCNDNQIQLPDKKLNGTIDGKAWMYETANAYSLSGQQFSIRFISENEPVRDPCTLPNPGKTHIRAIFEPFIGSYTVFAQAVDKNQVQVAFQTSPSTTITATSGFMEIYDISSGIILGYLQAELGDENKVEGSFQIRICN